MKILVIGESCLDVYNYGTCKRMAPEAPVPVFNLVSTTSNGGMAMNVYNNIKKLLNNVDLHTNKNWQEIKKTRFVEENCNHMFLRLDENDNDYGRIKIDEIDFSKYDAIVVSDYNKGYMTEEDLKKISLLHHRTFLDTKKILGEWCKSFTFIKINDKEYQNTKEFLDDDMTEILIITQGSKGCKYKDKVYTVPLVEVKDVSGAGDTFLAGFSYKFALTGDVEKSIEFANECATTVVQKKGVTTI